MKKTRIGDKHSGSATLLLSTVYLFCSTSLNSRWRKSEEYQEQLATCEGQSVEDYVTSLVFTELVAALQTGTEDLKLA
jgi:hypothetical protein